MNKKEIKELQEAFDEACNGSLADVVDIAKTQEILDLLKIIYE